MRLTPGPNFLKYFITIVEQHKGASLGKAPALITNNGQGWQGLPGTNALAYDVNYGRKSFMRLTPVANVIKLFAVFQAPHSTVGSGLPRKH
jgi:hypothetical protein